MSDSDRSDDESSEEDYFDINIQVGGNELFRLKPKHHPNKIGKGLKVSQLKNLIQFERDLYNQDISLTYKDIELNDNKTLGYYGIKNDKNLIAMTVNDDKNKKLKIKKKQQNIKDGVIILEENEEEAINILNKEIDTTTQTLKQLTTVIKGNPNIFLLIKTFPNLRIFFFFLL